ncbi:hypothetical protein HanRHA438_Chr16g0750311 [Helianthus annuus]|uniref:Uncharacterized protein n=1 Tax=Helianthus annuus TaxID=4232 RepID=A0A9K3GXG9_HELAN|nr:hypothetical protein HanXRQr2_Chr16g0738161 [Helianthus annuus]KAJ0441831.1 hypothetical protein HanIR_Chr16g0802321 [Helianthus annuus]KAJ0820407.1 hypothetical protein HanPSC8_Chr16g0707671 [Helianthus annuus]KAJ0835015.1 hypothetical protein HanRHA438_Chr16g0750311 [Helianthus annuus]
MPMSFPVSSMTTEASEVHMVTIFGNIRMNRNSLPLYSGHES